MSFRFALHRQFLSTRRLPLRELSFLERRALRPIPAHSQARGVHVSPARHVTGFTNILAAPPVQVKSITNEGIQLLDGLSIPSACIFLEGQVYLWSVPTTLWDGWGKEQLEIFETVLPKPGKISIIDKGVLLICNLEILLLGTGKTTLQAPPWLRMYLNQLGIQLDVMDTVSITFRRCKADFTKTIFVEERLFDVQYSCRGGQTGSGSSVTAHTMFLGKSDANTSILIPDSVSMNHDTSGMNPQNRRNKNLSFSIRLVRTCLPFSLACARYGVILFRCFFILIINRRLREHDGEQFAYNVG